jgi:hypothetical protein
MSPANVTQKRHFGFLKNKNKRRNRYSADIISKGYNAIPPYIPAALLYSYYTYNTHVGDHVLFLDKGNLLFRRG